MRERVTLSLLNLRYSSNFHLDTGLTKSPEQWIWDTSSDTFYADGYFVELCNEFLSQEIERYHSIPKEGVVALLKSISFYNWWNSNTCHFPPNKNWDTCWLLPACFWDLEGLRVFGRICVILFLFYKKYLSTRFIDCIGHF